MKTGWDTKELKADPVPLQQHSDPSVQKGAHPRTDGWDGRVKRQKSPSLSSPFKFCFANTAAIYGAVNSTAPPPLTPLFVKGDFPPSSKFRNFRGVWGTATAKGHAWTWGGEVKRMTQ